MQQPLAYRMRPRHLDEVVGQQHLVGPGKIIRRMVEAKMLSSMILYGPPGTGKPVLPAQSLVQQIMPSHVERGHRHKKIYKSLLKKPK